MEFFKKLAGQLLDSVWNAYYTALRLDSPVAKRTMRLAYNIVLMPTVRASVGTSSILLKKRALDVIVEALSLTRRVLLFF